MNAKSNGSFKIAYRPNFKLVLSFIMLKADTHP